jgi:hypothetical protein
LNRSLDRVALASVCGAVIGGDGVVPKPDGHIDVGLFNRFELRFMLRDPSSSNRLEKICAPLVLFDYSRLLECVRSERSMYAAEARGSYHIIGFAIKNICVSTVHREMIQSDRGELGQQLRWVSIRILEVLAQNNEPEYP